MKENIIYIILGIFLVLLLVVAALTWIGIMYFGISEEYNKNPNTLFIIIPFIIFTHWFAYKVFTKTRC